jgi:hypothetical protein
VCVVQMRNGTRTARRRGMSQSNDDVRRVNAATAWRSLARRERGYLMGPVNG